MVGASKSEAGSVTVLTNQRSGVDGGPCEFSLITSLKWTFEFGSSLGLGFGLLWGLDLGKGLDNKPGLRNRGLIKYYENNEFS